MACRRHAPPGQCVSSVKSVRALHLCIAEKCEFIYTCILVVWDSGQTPIFK